MTQLKSVSEKFPRAPDHLQPATAEWFDQVVHDYELESHHVKMLVLAAEAWDRAEEARQMIAVGGITYLDRYGCPHVHPSVLVERDSRLAFCRIIREIDLDAEVLPQNQLPRRGRTR